jgi:membrane protease YdiL (CAAX protease family)
VSSPPNPWSDPGFLPIPEPPAPIIEIPAENPVWSGWDVLQIVFFTLGASFVFLAVMATLAQRLIYRGLPWVDLAQKPVLALISEFLAYIAVLIFMVALVEGRYQVSFLKAIGWNWPQHKYVEIAGLIGLGALLLVVLSGVSHFLPIPKRVPVDQFFSRPMEAYLTSLFAISFGPFMEELFFRGFLYPVLARRLGVWMGVFTTALGFGLLHAMQLGFAWGPILIIFIVGVVLTITRVAARSVAASFLVHVAYNSTLTVITFIGTDGFRHLEKLNQ